MLQEYIVCRLPEGDEHIIADKLRTSSLLLFDGETEEIRTHQVVYSTLRSNQSNLLKRELRNDAYVRAAVFSFESLVNCETTGRDLIAETKTLVPHFCELFSKIESFCKDELETFETGSTNELFKLDKIISVAGHICSINGQVEKAKHFYELRLSINRALHVNNCPTVALILVDLGKACNDFGQLDEARDYHQQALTILQAVYGNNHPHVAASLSSLGRVCNDLGQLDEARDYHQRALTMQQAMYGNNHPHVAISLGRLGSVYNNLSQLDEARDYHQQALTIQQAVYGNNHPHVAASLNNPGAGVQ